MTDSHSDLPRWTKSRIAPFIERVNALTGETFPTNDPLVVEALIGLYDDCSGQKDSVSIEDAVRFLTGRGAVRAHETLSNQDLREKLIGGVAAALVMGGVSTTERPVVPLKQRNPRSITVPTPRAIPPKPTAKQPAVTRLPVVSTAASYYDGQWWIAAACRNQEPELFFPTTEENAKRIAKEVCQSCVVRTACLEEALRHNEKFGVWGGTTEEERRSLHKRWSRQRNSSVRDSNHNR